MALNLRPTAGSKVYAVAAAPATFDATGYAALTWDTEVGGFDQVPEMGNAYESGTFDAVASGRHKYRAILDPGDEDVSFADIPDDPGQIVLKAAFDAPRGGAGETISIKIEDEAGYGTYARVKVSRWRRAYGGAVDLIMRNSQFMVEPGTVVEFAPA